MTRHLMNYLKKQIDTVYPDNDAFKLDALTTEALITSQKILQSTENIKKYIMQNPHMKASKLLLLCTELELIYKDLMHIKHEYNL